jgi:hypothetical protein
MRILAALAPLILLTGCAVSPISVTSEGQLALVLDEQGRLPSFDLTCGPLEGERQLTNCQAYRFDPATQELVRVSQSDKPLITEVQPIPHSDRLLSVRDGDLYLEPAQRDPARRLLDLDGQIRTPRVSPNGQWVALSHLKVEGGFQILSDPDKAVIKDWSLQVRRFAGSQVGDEPFSLTDVVAYEWANSTLWALTLRGRDRDQLGAIKTEGDMQLALQRVTCAQACESEVHWQAAIPAESVELYAGIPIKLAPGSFFALNAATGEAWVVAMAAPPSDDAIEPHRRRLSKLVRVDLSSSDASGALVRWNAFHPSVGPDDALAYWAPSGIVAESGRRSQFSSSCLSSGADALADRLRCLVVGTAIYQRRADGTEQQLTPALNPGHLLLSQTFWVSDRQLGYVEFETKPSEASDSAEVTITGNRLKAIDTRTGETTNLSQTIRSILQAR